MERLKIKAALALAEFPQTALAAEVGCSEQHLCYVLRGRRRPSLRLAEQIASAMARRGVRIDAAALVAEASRMRRLP